MSAYAGSSKNLEDLKGGFAEGSIEPKSGLARKVGGNPASPLRCANPKYGVRSVCAFTHTGKPQ